MMTMMPTRTTVHIHSGDSAAQTAATRLAGNHLSYSDLLMVGPIPSLADTGLEQFLERRSEVLHEELSVEGYSQQGIYCKITGELQAIRDALKLADAVFLWYDHCLFDQQLLHFMLTACLQAYTIPMYLVPCPMDCLGFGELTAEELSRCQQQARLLAQTAVAESVSTIWPAFTSSDKEELIRLSQMTCESFPDTPAAAQRLLDELPKSHNGLNTLEFNILGAVLDGRSQFVDIFKAVSAKERYPFFGDTYVRKRIEVLSGGACPLLRIHANGCITATLEGARTLWGWGHWRHPRYVANLRVD